MVPSSPVAPEWDCSDSFAVLGGCSWNGLEGTSEVEREQEPLVSFQDNTASGNPVCQRALEDPFSQAEFEPSGRARMSAYGGRESGETFHAPQRP
jgi:hypothetical protein